MLNRPEPSHQWRGHRWKFTYEYDFTEDWKHSIRLEKILPFDPAFQYPVCLAGKRACPPEDIGGPEVYDQFLAKLFHQQMKVWVRLGAILSDEQKLIVSVKPPVFFEYI